MTSEEMARKWIKEWIRCGEQMASGADEGALVLLLDEAREQGVQAERERVLGKIRRDVDTDDGSYSWDGRMALGKLLRRLEAGE